MEELVWSDSLEWGYYKHPPLPSWIMHGMISLFGQSAWLTFITGQLSVVLALFFIWKLGCEFSFHPAARTKQKSYSLVAMLLTSTIFYFTVQGVMPNHNTMQLWSIAGAIWMFYRAIRHQRLSDWAWLGMFSGFAMLTKYSALIQFFCFFVYLFSAGKLKQKATWQGIAVAILIFLLLVAPHIFWLSQQGSSGSNPLSYANHSLNKDFTRLEHLINIRRFLFNSIGRIAPFLIALSLLIFWNKKGSDPQASSQSVPAAQLKSTETILSHLASSDRLFLLIIGIGPLAFTLLFALIFKMPLNASWASTFFLLFGFFSWGILSEFGPLLRRTIVIVIILQMISSIGFAAVRGPIAQQVGRATRSIYPSKEVSNQFLSIWTHYNETPLTLIAGDTWTAGAIAIHAPHKIQILIDGDYTRSPWIRNTDIRCGMLVVVDHTVGSEPVPAGLIDLRNLSSHKGHLTIPWTNKSNGPQVEVDWGVIPAKKNCLK
jgi:4-amino-4-deoxy-L-arabinose transferase-like glycosyltransferase